MNITPELRAQLETWFDFIRAAADDDRLTDMGIACGIRNTTQPGDTWETHEPTLERTVTIRYLLPDDNGRPVKQ